MAWSHSRLVMLARQVLDHQYSRSFDIELGILALQSRLALTRDQVWDRIRRLARG